MHISHLHLKNFRRFSNLTVRLSPTLTVLVGENDRGKTAVLDAVRLVLGTTSNDPTRIDTDDFHVAADSADAAGELAIRCTFSALSEDDASAFVEHLTYEGGQPELHITLRAVRRSGRDARLRPFDVSWRSGKDGLGPWIEQPTRELLQATYLRPLRDAERELSAGRNSRLSQVLRHTSEITRDAAEEFDPKDFIDKLEGIQAGARHSAPTLPRGLPSIARLTDALLQNNKGIGTARDRLDRDYLHQLSLLPDELHSRMTVASAGTDEARVRQLLEKLELSLRSDHPADVPLPRGLGYNNLLFMACELLLLGQPSECLPTLLIEEPEAHLHPQLQLRLVEFLVDQIRLDSGVYPKQRPVQIIMTTHSTVVASKVPLDHLLLLTESGVNSLAPGDTHLSQDDYAFLERFLDATRANLFFARAVLIVEGDAEVMLLPTLAKLLGRDLTRHGVSLVNVGGTGLGRYARIFMKRGGEASIPIPVACVTDCDVMPNCAPAMLRLKLTSAGTKPPRARWHWEREFTTDEEKAAWRARRITSKGGTVTTFVSDHWTLEYDLALSGLESELREAIALVLECPLETLAGESDGEGLDTAAASGSPEERATALYWHFRHGGVSKAAVAQQLAKILSERYGGPDQASVLRAKLPEYLVNAIEYVTTAIGSDGGTADRREAR